MDRTERLGLGISTAGHVLLLAAISVGLLETRVTLPPPPTPIDVSIADAVALESRTPSPSTEAPPVAEAPEAGPAEPDATPPPPAAPAPPQPRTVAPPSKPVAAPAPAAPARAVKALPQSRPVPATTPPRPVVAPKPPRASRLGADFLKGLDGDKPAPRVPAAAPGISAPMGPEAARALNSEINRQIKPYWRPPSGADADRLVTLLSVHLDRDGAVVGKVEVVGQQGITASNRAQADLHAERAVQAVMRASPFRNLPAEFYDQWKWLKPLRFDARLAQ